MQWVAGLVFRGNLQLMEISPATAGNSRVGTFFLQHQNFSSLNKSLENPYLVEKKVTEFFTSFWSSRSSSRFWIVGCFSGISAQRNSEVWLKSIREDGNEQCNLRMQKSPPRCIKTTGMHKESSQPGIFVENVWQHFVAAVKLHLSLWGATCIPRWGHPLFLNLTRGNLPSN